MTDTNSLKSSFPLSFKKKLIRSYVLLCCCIWLFLPVKTAFGQQDAQFSQYMFNGIYINPAYAGYKEVLNIHSFFRSQWTGVKGAPRTLSIAVDAAANDGNVGLALLVSADKLGAQRNLSAYANYAYRLRLNEDGSSRLAFGIGAGMVQLGIDGSVLNPNTPEQFFSTETNALPDARAGVYYADNRFYAGFSADNLISQYINSDRFIAIPKPRPHFYLTAGVLVPFNEDLLLKPSFLLKDDRGGPTSLDVSAFLIFGEKLWVGGSYRTDVKLYNKDYLQNKISTVNSVVAAAQFFPNESLRIGYAYDFSIGPLMGYGSGTHEISIGYYFPRKYIRMRTPRYF